MNRTFRRLLTALALVTATPAMSQEIPQTPIDVAQWMKEEMTCAHYLAVGGDAGEAAPKGAQIVVMMAFMYIEGVAKALGVKVGDVHVATMLNCMSDPAMLFVDAPFPN